MWGIVRATARVPTPLHTAPALTMRRGEWRSFRDHSKGGEIAEALVLALSTVKSHVRNILSKLEVSNRTQAVKRARNLGLLPDKP